MLKRATKFIKLCLSIPINSSGSNTMIDANLFLSRSVMIKAQNTIMKKRFFINRVTQRDHVFQLCIQTMTLRCTISVCLQFEKTWFAPQIYKRKVTAGMRWPWKFCRRFSMFSGFTFWDGTLFGLPYFFCNCSFHGLVFLHRVELLRVFFVVVSLWRIAHGFVAQVIYWETSSW